MSDGMKAQYQILGELRRVDDKISRLQAEVGRIPDETAKLNVALSSKREEFTKLKSTVDDNEKKLRKAEQDLKAKEDSLTKAQEKMMEVKTNEEYQAAIKENSNQKETKSGFEDTVLKLLNDVEDQKRRLKESEEAFKAYENTINEDLKRIEAERTRILQLLEEQIVVRNSKASQLAPEGKALYQQVTTRMRGGVAVVSVENGMCMGCHMKLRSQLYNEILGYKTIHRCPTCGRILVLLSQESESSDAEAATK